jgi:beta-glucosidase-like glycosyl hydrolase
VVVPSGIRRDIGQLLIGSLPGTTISPELRSLAREFQLGGVTLFARNIEAPEQVAELSYDLSRSQPVCRSGSASIRRGDALRG